MSRYHLEEMARTAHIAIVEQHNKMVDSVKNPTQWERAAELSDIWAAINTLATAAADLMIEEEEYRNKAVDRILNSLELTAKEAMADPEA